MSARSVTRKRPLRSCGGRVRPSRYSPEAVPRVFHAADPVYHAPLVPATLIHGTADDIVPIELSRNFVENHKGGKVKLIELAAGHFDLIDPQSSAWPEVLNITRSHCHTSF